MRSFWNQAFWFIQNVRSNINLAAYSQTFNDEISSFSFFFLSEDATFFFDYLTHICKIISSKN